MQYSRYSLLSILLLYFIVIPNRVCFAASAPTALPDLSPTPGPSRSDATIPLIFIANQGQLKVSTPFGSLVDQAPIAWQDTHEGRRSIPCAYNLSPNNPFANSEYGFTLETYDPRLPLVLDPGFTVYSGLIGGSGADAGRGIAVDAAGNAYIAGFTTSADFPRTVGLAHAGDFDVIVVKIGSSQHRSSGRLTWLPLLLLDA